MHRTRLTRAFCLTLFAISGLVALSYFPLSSIGAAHVGATVLPSAAKPLVNLKTPQTLKVTYAGAADAVAAMQAGTASPTALAAADFNADGAMDVVAGYSTKSGGVLALYKGNPDAFAPKDTTLYQKAMKGNVPSTFLSQASAFTTPESPDLLATGDFNRDGKPDVLVAARGGNLYLLAGDGSGNLASAQPVALADQVIALAATPDGHVAVSTDGRSGPQVTILAPSVTGLTAEQTFSLPGRGTSVAWGTLGGGMDLAVGAGSNVVLIYSALTANPQTETVTVPFEVKGLALGDFIWDRDGRTEIAVLAGDGSIRILQHGTLNTAPLTAKDIPGRRAAMRAKGKQPPSPTSLGAWTVAKQLTHTGSAPSGPVSPSAFSSPRVAASSTHDLMLIDAGRSQLNILDTSGKTASPSAGISFSGAPVAALAMPQRINASRDIVVLTSSQSALTLVTADADPTFNVTTTADEDDAGACTITSTVTSGAGSDGVLSLREAVCEANNNGAATSVINVPAGTYSLHISTFGGNGSASSSGELQVGIQSGNNITISGAGAGSTIIQQTDGIDRVIEADELVKGNEPLTIQNVTLQNGNCNDTSGLDCVDNGGGAILAGGPGDNLTITNVTMSNNAANPTATTTNQENGGALTYAGPILTVTNSTFSSNTASGAGGGIYDYDGFFNSNYLIGPKNITNSSFTNNTNIIAGGAINFSVHGGTNVTISGSTFTGNKTTESNGDGGAINAETFAINDGNATFGMSTSRIVGNSAPQGATGVYLIDVTPTIDNNWWGCNAGPNASGCDSVLQDVSGTNTPYFPSTWLVLGISANPAQIVASATSTLTADLTHNNASTGGFSVPDGTPVTFGGTLDSSVNPTSSTLGSGQATSTYTAGTSAGHGTGTATVDNQQVSTPVEILDSVTVATNSTGLSIAVDTVTYTAPQTFNWVVGSSHTIATTSPQSGPGVQYVFSTWSDSGGQSHPVTAPAAATIYTANFNTQYQLTTQASPSADGSVTPASGGFFDPGATISVTATPNGGFMFANWTSTGGTFDSATTASTNFHMPAAAATVTGNFSLIIVATPTTTTVASNNNPSFTTTPGNSVTFTATVSSTSTVNEGTVTFSDPASDFTCSGGNTVAVSNGTATCTTSFSTEGSRNVTAAYNGTVDFLPSSGFVTQTVNNHTVQTGNQFCNPGAITIPGTAGAATPYPSNIFVTGLSGNVGKVTVALNNISSSNIAQTDLLLVGPTGAQIVPFASVGDGSTISGVDIVLDDAAAGAIPGGSPLTTGSYRPTSITGSNSLVFPAPAPAVGTANYAATDGPATLTTQFGGTAPNGTWALYAMDNSGSSAASIGGGWCVNIAPATVQTTITTSPAGLLVSVDGGTATAAPLVENWIPGSSHIIATSSPQSGGTGVQYVFDNWSDNGAISHSITVPSTAITYTATFNTQYQLTTQASPPADGSVTPASGSFYAAGAVVPVTATAIAGFQFSNWTSTGGTFDSTTAASTNFHMPSAPATVTGNFAAATAQITITTSPANLLVSVDGGTATAAPLVETWNIGSSHTIATTSPQAGAPGVQYVFTSWSDSGAITHSITVPSTATTYSATFNTQYQLTTQASPPADGSVTPASGSFYAAGAVVPVTATAIAGFQFSNWTSTGGTFDSTTAASTNFHMPSAPATVTANFVVSTVQVMVGTSPAGRTFTVDSTTYTSAQTFTWNVGSSHTLATTSPQAGTAGTQYVFSNWSDGGGLSHSVTAPLTATTYTATFNTQYQLTTAVNPSNGGTVSPPSGGFYTAGTVVPLTATPNAGFTFSNWTGNVANSTSASTTITMSAPQSVTANFIAPQVSLNPTTINFGNVYLFNVKSQNVTVKNIGTASLTISKVSLTQTSGDDFAFLNFCPSTLGVGKSCVISVFFFADDAHSDSATLNVADNAPGSPQHVSLSATVINPVPGFKPFSLNFGTVKVGHSSTQNVTLTNIGTTTLTISSVGVTGANTGDFLPNSGCPSSLAPNAHCTIAVTFTPSTTGSRSANLTVVDNAQISRQNVALSGTGGH